MAAQAKPVVALVGRPNVGKSTLFNRLIGERRALVHEKPGMTRDRHYGEARHLNRPFVVIDTGGYEDKADTPLLSLMREQTLIAIEEADRVIFLTEESVPSDPVDMEIIERLRRSGKPFFLAVNKADSQRRQMQAYSDFAVYGLDMVYPVSALHGEGILDLLDDVAAGFPHEDEYEDNEGEGPIRVAIVGRVNAGKSTLTNRLLGSNRVIASEMPGTTRDSIDSEVTAEGQAFTLIDTAGIRRRGKIERGAEKLSVHSAFRAIDRCEVALLIIDISEGITTQDTHIAGYILESGKACVLVLNKWDAVPDRENYGKYIQQVREHFNFLKWAPILTISAKTGQRAHRLWALIQHCAEQYRREFSTRDLNRILRMALAHVSPPITGGRALSLKYVTQTSSCPPRLTFFVNDPKLMHFSYERYLQNQFRAQLGVEGTPIRFSLRRKAEEKNWLPENRTRKRPEEPERLPDDLQPIEIGEETDWEAGFYEEEDEDT